MIAQHLHHVCKCKYTCLFDTCSVCMVWCLIDETWLDWTLNCEWVFNFWLHSFASRMCGLWNATIYIRCHRVQNRSISIDRIWVYSINHSSPPKSNFGFSGFDKLNWQCWCCHSNFNRTRSPQHEINIQLYANVHDYILPSYTCYLGVRLNLNIQEHKFQIHLPHQSVHYAYIYAE